LSFIQDSDDFCELTVDVEVRDVDHMEQMMDAIRGSRVVSEANRVIFKS
jgi:(p)ppGpp synthase/HD superfamily hydrolase